MSGARPSGSSPGRRRSTWRASRPFRIAARFLGVQVGGDRDCHRRTGTWALQHGQILGWTSSVHRTRRRPARPATVDGSRPPPTVPQLSRRNLGSCAARTQSRAAVRLLILSALPWPAAASGSQATSTSGRRGQGGRGHRAQIALRPDAGGPCQRIESARGARRDETDERDRRVRSCGSAARRTCSGTGLDDRPLAVIDCASELLSKAGSASSNRMGACSRHQRLLRQAGPARPGRDARWPPCAPLPRAIARDQGAAWTIHARRQQTFTRPIPRTPTPGPAGAAGAAAAWRDKTPRTATTLSRCGRTMQAPAWTAATLT